MIKYFCDILGTELPDGSRPKFTSTLVHAGHTYRADIKIERDGKADVGELSAEAVLLIVNNESPVMAAIEREKAALFADLVSARDQANSAAAMLAASNGQVAALTASLADAQADVQQRAQALAASEIAAKDAELRAALADVALGRDANDVLRAEIEKQADELAELHGSFAASQAALASAQDEIETLKKG